MAKNKKLRSIQIVFEKAMWLQSKGISFDLEGVNGSYTLKTDFYDWDYVSKFKEKLNQTEINFIKKVKSHVKKENIFMNFIDPIGAAQIQYVATQEFPNGTEFNDVYEVDIDEAYWKTAKMLNVITEEIYNEGKKSGPDAMRKTVRLMALGSLAKKTKTYRFQGKKMILLPDTKNSETENIWFTICKKVSDLMVSAQKMAGSEFVMFWVDGIYVRGEHHVKMISDLFESAGYASKVNKIHKVIYKNRVIYCQDSEKEEIVATEALVSTDSNGNKVKSYEKGHKIGFLIGSIGEEYYQIGKNEFVLQTQTDFLRRPFHLPNPAKKKLPLPMDRLNEIAKKYSK